MRRAAKVDVNQPALVADIRKCGYSVYIVSQLKGFCDIIVGARGKNFLFEIKDPDKPPSKQRLTEAEENFHLNWLGQVSVVTNLNEVLEVVQGNNI